MSDQKLHHKPATLVASAGAEEWRALTAEILEAAAGRIEATGWQRGTLGTLDGPNCIAGAIGWEAYRRAAKPDILDIFRNPGAKEAYWALNRLNLATPGPMFWNDQICVNAAAAAAALRDAAKAVANG